MKKLLKKFLNILGYTSIFVALTGVSLIYTSSLLFKFPISLELLLIVFLSVFSVYNLNKITDVMEDKINYPERVSFIQKHKTKILISSIISYIFALFIAFFRSILVGIFVFIPLIGVFIYSVSPIRLKRLLGIKNIWVSLLWSVSVTILPIIYFNKFELLLSFTSFSLFLFIFLKGIGNTITFDIRDIEGDKKCKIETLPMRIGLNKTKILLSVINLLSFILLLITTFLGFISPIGYAISLVTFYTFVYIYLIEKTDLKFLTDILADGEFIVIGLLAFIGNFLSG
ncbi:MAG: UbiA family prenyltransferase [Candidatus Aenigmatarchaeota archaeon]